MNKKKSALTIETVVAILLVLAVVLVMISWGPNMWELIKTAIGFAKFDDDNKVTNINDIKPTEKRAEVKGELIYVVSKTIEAPTEPKPTSIDHCFVGTLVRNIGETIWTDADKIRITLFCKHTKGQIKEIFIENYPPGAQDYITNLKPGEEKEVGFASRFPNNCLKSITEKYIIVLYSNCEGKGTQYQPCDNFGIEPSKSPRILDSKEFYCK